MKRRSPGLGLIELVVCMALFGMLSIVFVMAMGVSRDANRQNDEHSDSQRACLLALTKLRQELRGARVMIPGVGSTHHLLRYRHLSLAPGGHPVVTISGEPSWGPVITCSMQAGGRYLSNESPPKILAQLGEGASLQFTRVHQKVLEVDIQTDQGRVVSRVALPNS